MKKILILSLFSFVLFWSYVFLGPVKVPPEQWHTSATTPLHYKYKVDNTKSIIFGVIKRNLIPFLRFCKEHKPNNLVLKPRRDYNFQKENECTENPKDFKKARDMWSETLIVKSTKKYVSITSKGGDKKLGTSDDITYRVPHKTDVSFDEVEEVNFPSIYRIRFYNFFGIQSERNFKEDLKYQY